MAKKKAKSGLKGVIANRIGSEDEMPWYRAILYFDGACEPINPGGIAVASWVITGGDADSCLANEGAVEICRGHGATNNVAEWWGLIWGLRSLENRQWEGALEIYGDSQLVINQILGKFAVKEEHLKPLYKEVSNILPQWTWDARHIPREENARADAVGKNHYKAIEPYILPTWQDDRRKNA